MPHETKMLLAAKPTIAAINEDVNIDNAFSTTNIILQAVENKPNRFTLVILMAIVCLVFVVLIVIAVLIYCNQGKAENAFIVNNIKFPDGINQSIDVDRIVIAPGSSSKIRIKPVLEIVNSNTVTLGGDVDLVEEEEAKAYEVNDEQTPSDGNVLDITEPGGVDFVQGGHQSELRKWLIHDVGLVEYYNNFVMNGYGCLAFVREIVNKSDLIDIGIDVKEHQIRILKEIKKLNVTTK